VIHDIRMRDGEINLLGGLCPPAGVGMTGIPGLSACPSCAVSSPAKAWTATAAS
jgi:hypothetical protein